MEFGFEEKVDLLMCVVTAIVQERKIIECYESLSESDKDELLVKEVKRVAKAKENIERFELLKSKLRNDVA